MLFLALGYLLLANLILKKDDLPPALIQSPKLLLDEPSLGLWPPFVKGAFENLTRINKELRSTIVIMEQKVREVLKIWQRVYLLKMGRVAYTGTSSDLLQGIACVKSSSSALPF